MSVNCAIFRAIAVAVAMSGIVLASCSSGPVADGSQRTVFPTTSPTLAGATMQGTVPTDVIVNFGIASLYNTSNARVTFRAVKLIKPSGSGIRDVAYHAYIGHGLVAPIGVQGDLPNNCPEHYKPVPLGSFSVRARSSGVGEVVVSFRIVKSGHYTVGTMRIDYSSGGHRYWQLYYLPLQITAVPAASDPRLVQPFRCSRKAYTP